MIGGGQASWIEQRLAASTATFKLIAAGTNFSQNTGGESWLDHAASRRRLFDFIRTRRIGGVVLLSGDIHRSHFRKIQVTGTGSYDLVELVSSPLANGGSSCAKDPAPDATQQACVSESALFVTVETDTTVADPTLVAKVVNLAGQVRATTTVRRSQLRTP
jgi:alkaline phosphatase D